MTYKNLSVPFFSFLISPLFILQLGSRNTIHLSKLKTDCRWGDLILFKCANSMSKLQRSVTGAEWDHVGIVVSFCNLRCTKMYQLN